MLRFLIVDDNKVRVDKLRETLHEAKIVDENIDICTCAMAGRKLLRSTQYDFLILDVCIPRREGDRPAKEEGINLIKDVSESQKYIIPEEIIGITAYDEVFDEVFSEFNKRMIHVIRYKESSNQWRDKLTKKILLKLGFKKDKLSGHAVVTVHGIRTYGQWQKLLEDTISEQGISAKVINFKYSFLPIFSYCSFIVKRKIAMRFSTDLNLLLKDTRYDTIDIIGHSFGTQLIAYALKHLEPGCKKKIRTVIFSGSVVPENFDWNGIVGKKIDRLINDCACDDFILLVNKCIIPFAGMSGRVGFKGFDEGVVNRFFKGGHDTFYMRDKTIDSYFIKKYWIPLLAGSNHIIKYDNRGKPGALEDLYFMIYVAAFLKDITCYVLPFWLIFYLVKTTQPYFYKILTFD